MVAKGRPLSPKLKCNGITRGMTVLVFLQAKVRRLYDIANVLTSLALIKKVHVTEERGRKPAFKWIGPVDFSSIGKEMRSFDKDLWYIPFPSSTCRQQNWPFPVLPVTRNLRLMTSLLEQ